MKQIIESVKGFLKSKDTKTKTNLIICLSAGLILLFLSSTNLVFNSARGSEPGIFQNLHENPAPNELNFVRDLEYRLADIFSMVDGAGNVQVMIHLARGREIVVAQDIRIDTTDTNETDSSGGSREIHTKRQDWSHIIMSDSSGQRPLILKEIEPVIEGVIIVAEGGDNIFVKDALIRAARTVLGVELHKVQVLKMRGE